MKFTELSNHVKYKNSKFPDHVVPTVKRLVKLGYRLSDNTKNRTGHSFKLVKTNKYSVVVIRLCFDDTRHSIASVCKKSRSAINTGLTVKEFIDGCYKNGMSKDQAFKLLRDINPYYK